MKKSYFLSAALISCCLVGCDKDPVEQATGIKATADTISVAYGKTVDLSEYFSVEPANASGTLTYSISKQPEYVEGENDVYTSVEVYSVSGSTLTSAEVRVPDVLNRSDAKRSVREGKLKVTAGELSVEVTIVQTNKPELLFPSGIKVSETLSDFTDGKLMLTTSGQPRYITAQSFVFDPIDFDPVDIRVGIGDAGNGNYITMSIGSDVPQAGGTSAPHGTGGYVVAYHKDYTLEEVLNNPNLLHIKLYVDVAEVHLEAVGIVANEEAIGKTGAASFYPNSTNGRQSPGGFILMKLEDGTTRAYDSSRDGFLIAGKFNDYLEGRTTDYTEEGYPGWWSHVALKEDNDFPPLGTEVSFTITHKSHFEETDWTVRIITAIVRERPTEPAP